MVVTAQCCAVFHLHPLKQLCFLQFLSRPFVVGDRVELSSGGGERVLVGVIERVDPMRTIVRTDASLPVTIPNKVIMVGCADQQPVLTCLCILKFVPHSGNAM